MGNLYFTNRKTEMALLDEYASLMNKGIPQNMSIVGLRKIGKTTLLRQFRRAIKGKYDSLESIFIDFEKLCISPDIFALRYIGYIVCSFSKNKELESFFSIENLLEESLKLQNNAIKRTVKQLFTEMNKAKPNQALLLDLAFSLPNKIAKENKINLLIIIDEFQYIKDLERFPQAKTIIGLFRSQVQTQRNVSYIISGSSITILEKIIKEGESPLFLHFKSIVLHPFTREDSMELSKKIFEDYMIDYDSQALETIHHLCSGHPFYIDSICSKSIMMSKSLGKPIDEILVQQAFCYEVFTSKGQLYSYCNYVYDISLEKTVGSGMLKRVLLVLTQQQSLKLGEIASQLKKQSGEVDKYVKSLVDVDVLMKEGDKYHFRDSVFGEWLRVNLAGGEPDIRNIKVVKDLIKDLRERHMGLSRELGIAVQSYIKEMINKFDNREIEGRFFNLNNKIKLPKFSKIEEYNSPDGTIEIDLICINGEKWAIGIRWREEKTDIKEVRKLKENVVADRYWYISKSSFKIDAINFMKENRMMFSEKGDIKDIAKEFNIRFLD